jgi:hypothetical protein
MTATTLFARIEDGLYAQSEAEHRLEKILGVDLLGIGFDIYDTSFEIYPLERDAEVAPTEEQHAQILALGCERYWINFADGTQRYGRGERRSATFNRWEAHNQCRDRSRRQVKEDGYTA